MSARDELALVITNAYRSRSGMSLLEMHATVDEHVADAIIAAGYVKSGFQLHDIALCCDHGYAICARCDLIPSSWNPTS